MVREKNEVKPEDPQLQPEAFDFVCCSEV
uniref:Uncharacterized protein n=1 Tax=Anguilla anguilla TaxID=7936 RepID=A0A0E9R329_ANGAN